MSDEKVKHMGHEVDIENVKRLRGYVLAHEQGKSYIGVLDEAELEVVDVGMPVPDPPVGMGRFVLKDARIWSFVLRPAPDGRMLPSRAIYPIALAPSAKTVWLNEPVIEPLAGWSDQDLAEVVLLIDQCEELIEEVGKLRARAGRPELRIVSRMPENLPKRPG